MSPAAAVQQFARNLRWRACLRPRFGVNELGADSLLVMLGDAPRGLGVGWWCELAGRIVWRPGVSESSVVDTWGAMSARIHGHAGVLADFA